MSNCEERGRERKRGARNGRRRSGGRSKRTAAIVDALTLVVLLASMAGPAAAQQNAGWQGRTTTAEGRVTWSMARPTTASRLRVGLAARRGLEDGRWDWVALDLARPIGSGRWFRGISVRTALRYEPARRGERVITGLERTQPITKRLSVVAGYYVHVVRTPATGPALSVHGVRLAANVRLPRDGRLTAMIGYGERPGGLRLDLAVRRQF